MTRLVRSIKSSLAVLALVGAGLGSTVASAHHSFALFDMGRLTTLTGTVTEWKWANPHTWLLIQVTRPNGRKEEWSLVGSSPNMMSRWGWKAGDVKAGDKIVIDVHPSRNGQHIGALKTAFLTNGKVLGDPAGSTGRALAQGPSGLPSKPQGQPYR